MLFLSQAPHSLEGAWLRVNAGQRQTLPRLVAWPDYFLSRGLSFSIYSSTYSFTHLAIFTEHLLCVGSYAGH